jgi:predicted NAD/FAD-binding protein
MDSVLRKKIAVIGSGIAGHYAVHRLKKAHEVMLYEAESRFGGHAHTVEIEGQNIPVDMGFIVYNELTYPRLTSLLEELHVKTINTDMSFGVRDDVSGLEYSTSSINGIFAQRKNIMSLSYLQIWSDFFKFKKHASRFMAEQSDDRETSLGELVREARCHPRFWKHFLYPMSGAIWSTAPEEMESYPATSFLRFMHNHRMLEPTGQPIWKTVVGGSIKYVEAIHELGGFERKTGAPVTDLIRSEGGVLVKAKNHEDQVYDEVVVATHSDQALKMLSTPSENEKSILGQIRYQPNRAVLHSDTSLMPKNRRAHASWNVHLHEQYHERVELTYDMNRLQHLKGGPWLVTLNPNETIDEKKIIREMDVMHPYFDGSALKAQDRWSEISGVDKIHYCGAYWKWGFHEDGLWSAQRVIDQMLGESPSPS